MLALCRKRSGPLPLNWGGGRAVDLGMQINLFGTATGRGLFGNVLGGWVRLGFAKVFVWVWPLEFKSSDP